MIRMGDIFVLRRIHKVGFLLLVLVSAVHAYPNGAPAFACGDLDPSAGHGASTANGPAPYQLTFSKNSYKPGERIQVVLSGIGGAQYKGFIIVGHLAGHLTSEPYGTFTDVNESIAKITCTSGKNGNGVTHSSPDIKSTLTFTWIAPSENVGDIIFRYTIVRGGAPNTSTNKADYFKQLESSVLKISDTPPNPGTFKRDARCGQEVGCYSNCVGDLCDWQITFVPKGDKIEFNYKSMSNGEDRYVSLGFSQRSAMFPASVLTCQTQAGNINVGLSTNPGYENKPLDNPMEGISNLTASNENGLFECEFLKDKVSTNPLINNLTDSWYLITARGAVNSDGSLMYHGPEHRFKTTMKVSAENVKVDIRFPGDFTTTPTSVATTPTTPTTTTAPNQGDKFKKDKSCGIDMGCYSDCLDGMCDWQIMFAPENDSIRFDFKSTLSGNVQYIAFGFSQASAMYPSSVLSCKTESGKVIVEISTNPSYSNKPLSNPSESISDVKTSSENGLLHCNFLRKKVSSNPLIYNLTNPWFFIAARGALNSDGSLDYHGPENRFKTDIKLSAENTTINLQVSGAKTTASGPTTSSGPSTKFAKDPGCGKTKGCYSDCDDGVCSLLLSWQNRNEFYEITLKSAFSASDNKWIALGLSNQHEMGDASVVECTIHEGKINAYSSFNNGYSNQRLSPNPNKGISNVTGSFKDGVISCTFFRITSSNDALIYSLDEKWYLVTARGDVGSDGEKIPHNLKNSFLTSTLVNFSDPRVDISMEELSYPIIKLHGCLMIGAWILSASIGIAVARFFKPLCPNTLLCGLKVWFIIHRTAMVITFCLGVAAFIIIFVEIDGYSEIIGEDYKKAHPILGIIVTSLLVINPFMSLLRCKPDDPKRPIFNWAHFIVGTSAHILSAVTITTGMYLPKAQIDGDKNLIVIIVYGAWQILFFIIMTFLDYYKSLNERDDTYSNIAHNPGVQIDKRINYDSIADISSNDYSDKQKIMDESIFQAKLTKTNDSKISSIKNFVMILHVGVLISITAYLIYTVIDAAEAS